MLKINSESIKAPNNSQGANPFWECVVAGERCPVSGTFWGYKSNERKERKKGKEGKQTLWQAQREILIWMWKLELLWDAGSPKHMEGVVGKHNYSHPTFVSSKCLPYITFLLSLPLQQPCKVLSCFCSWGDRELGSSFPEDHLRVCITRMRFAMGSSWFIARSLNIDGEEICRSQQLAAWSQSEWSGIDG